MIDSANFRLRTTLVWFAILAAPLLFLVSASDTQRPAFHYYAGKNWMNDPNGPIFFDGKYHLFYQYNPNGSLWSNMNWGHAVSRDLVTWRRLDVALSPTPGGYDSDGVYTGSTIIANSSDEGDSKVLAFYTGVWPEVQCAAVSEDPLLLKWRKLDANPLIDHPPVEGLTAFRDPAIFKPAGSSYFFMVVGAGLSDGRPAVLAYRSIDLMDWTYAGPLYIGDAATCGKDYECPDVFVLSEAMNTKGSWVRKQFNKIKKGIGAVPGTPDVKRAAAVLMVSLDKTRRTVYYIGDVTTVDGEPRFAPIAPGAAPTHIDYGVFYAAKSFDDPLQGRRIVFGWLPEERANSELVAAGWAGVMSLPRVLSLRYGEGGEPMLDIEPLPDLSKLRNTDSRVSTSSPRTVTQTRTVPGVSGDQLELEVTFALNETTARHIGVVVRQSPDEREGTPIYLDRESCTLVVDRSKSSLNPLTTATNLRAPIRKSRCVPGSDDEPLMTFHIYVDHSVVEVFVDRATPVAFRVYPTLPAATQVALLVDGGTTSVMSFDSWLINGIW